MSFPLHLSGHDRHLAFEALRICGVFLFTVKAKIHWDRKDKALAYLDFAFGQVILAIVLIGLMR